MRIVGLALCLLLACGDDDGGTDAGRDTGMTDSGRTDSGVDSGVDAGVDAATDDAATDDAATGDAGVDAATGDAATDDAATSDAGFDANGDGGSGAVCSFNSDCPETERCECDEATGCFCFVGPRGTGRNGLDACTDGNDCASALCVEGPSSSGTFYCSDECATMDDCEGMLPRCLDIAFVGRICVRDPE